MNSFVEKKFRQHLPVQSTQDMIIALAGRRIDAPGTNPGRFPLAHVESVKNKLVTWLRLAHATQLVCSGACGADLVALQAADELGIIKTMILPFDADTFRTTSVTDRPGNWGSMYDQFVTELKRSNRVIELNYDKNDVAAYLNTNLRILDQAQRMAQSENEKDPHPGSPSKITAVIVWEGKPKDADDSTYHFKTEAEKRNYPVTEILTDE